MRKTVFRQSVFAIIIFAHIVCLTGCSRAPIAKKQIIVVFRYDDYSAQSATDLEVKIIAAFRQHNAVVTFGVIPYVCAGDVHDPSSQKVVPLSAIKGDILKAAFEAKVVEIALHGYSHQTIHPKHYTEFTGLDYHSQVEKIARGRQLLERMTDAPVTVFFPPWNQYDLNTLRALEDLRFSIISANLSGEARKDSRLKFLPVTCDLLQLRHAIAEARSSSADQPVILVLFHAYDFQEIDQQRGRITYQEFLALLNRLSSENDISLISLNQTVARVDEASARHFMSNKIDSRLLRLIPTMLSHAVPKVYPASDRLNELRLLVTAFYLTIVAVSISVVLLGKRLLFPKAELLMKICKYGSLAGLILALISTLHDSYLSYRGATVMALLFGVCVGIWWPAFLHHKPILLIENNINQPGNRIPQVDLKINRSH